MLAGKKLQLHSALPLKLIHVKLGVLLQRAKCLTRCHLINVLLR